MKTGELIILWVGGLLSVVVVVGGLGVSDLDLRVYGAGTIVSQALSAAGKLISIWILCGLVWLTIYKRQP